MALFHHRPYLPPPSPAWIPSAPAVSGAISGTASITFGQSATLTGDGALAATTTITFSQSGALRGQGALAGSAALVIGQTGALAATGSLAGSTSLTFGQAGTLAGAGALAGSAPITFAASATADVPTGALSGAAAISFGASATLAADGALAGTAPISFGASATADQSVTTQPGQTFAGGFARHRRRRLYLEIDGQQFDVESAEHAQALLDQVKALAQRVAPEKAEVQLIRHLATNPRIRPKIERPHIVTHSPELHALVQQTRRIVSDTYKAAYRDAEIRLRLATDDESDDDDLMMLL